MVYFSMDLRENPGTFACFWSEVVFSFILGEIRQAAWLCLAYLEPCSALNSHSQLVALGHAVYNREKSLSSSLVLWEGCGEVRRKWSLPASSSRE